MKVLLTYSISYLGDTSETTPTAERLVAWLLEHPDECLSDSGSISSFDGLSDKDSISDDMNTSYTEEVILVVSEIRS